jgi:hypothetical protein
MLARLSYPLNRLVFNLLERHSGTVHVLQIGASDGKTADTLLHHGGWHGVLVEPVPCCFQMLQQEYAGNDRIMLRQAGIDHTAGERVIY